MELDWEEGGWGKSELQVSSGEFGVGGTGEGGGSMGATLRRFVCDRSDPIGEEPEWDIRGQIFAAKGSLLGMVWMPMGSSGSLGGMGLGSSTLGAGSLVGALGSAGEGDFSTGALASALGCVIRLLLAGVPKTDNPVGFAEVVRPFFIALARLSDSSSSLPLSPGRRFPLERSTPLTLPSSAFRRAAPVPTSLFLSRCVSWCELAPPA